MAQAMLEAAAAGVTEAEVYAAGMAAAFRRGCQARHADVVRPRLRRLGAAELVVPAGAATGLNAGDVLLAEVVSRFGMKETQHQVAIAIGSPHPDIETAAAIARASYQEGLRAARIGNSFGDLAEAMLAPLRQAGSWNIHPLVRTLNPFGPVGGFGGRGLDQDPAGTPLRSAVRDARRRRRAAAGTGNVVGVRAQRGGRRPGGEPRRHGRHRRGQPDRAQPLHRPAAPRLKRTAAAARAIEERHDPDQQ